jgi:two-component system LytT family response regulator
MRALVIDDEGPNRENLIELLKIYCPDVLVTGEAETVEDGSKLIKQLQPELVFLDIQLHGQSGFELLKQPGINFEVIFVTAYDQYGIQAVKFAALDYLLKPIDIEELKTAVEKARQVIAKKQKNEKLDYLLEFLKDENKTPAKIALPLFNETRYIAIDEIIRCEADNTYTLFVLTSGERVLVSKTLKEYADMLAAHGFLRTHQTHLVNIKHIKSWLREDGGAILLKDGTKIPVSKLNRDKVKEALAKGFKL